MHFKKIDFILQTAIIGASLLIGASKSDKGEGLIFFSIAFYGGLAFWQTASAIIHLINRKLVTAAQSRVLYLILYPFALLVCIYPFLSGELDNLPASMITGLVMAVSYYIITIVELFTLRKTFLTA